MYFYVISLQFSLFSAKFSQFISLSQLWGPRHIHASYYISSFVSFCLILLLLLLPLVLLLILLLGLRLRLHLRHVPCLLRILILLSEMSPKQKTPSLNRAISHRSGTLVWPRREREAFTINLSIWTMLLLQDSNIPDVLKHSLGDSPSRQSDPLDVQSCAIFLETASFGASRAAKRKRTHASGSIIKSTG